MQVQVNESDRKLFRSRLPGWQEAYMDRLNREYIRLLSAPGNPADKFRELEKRILEHLRKLIAFLRRNEEA